MLAFLPVTPVTARATIKVDNVLVNGALYDDFSAADGFMDPAKWNQREFTKEIRNGKVVFRHTGSNPSNNPIRFVGEASINKIAADFTVVNIDERGNGSANSTRARIRGNWFNDNLTGAADQTGDVFAHLQIRDFVVQFFSQICEDPTCSTFSALTNPGSTTVGLVQPGTTHTLYLEWDTTAKVFRYQLDNQTPVSFNPALATDATNRTVNTSNAVAAFSTNKVIETRVNENNRFIEATVDNVRAAP